MKAAALAFLLALGADDFQSRSPYSPCNPYSLYCQPQLGTPYVDAGSVNVIGPAASESFGNNRTQPGPTLTVFSAYFDGGNWLDGGDVSGTVTLRQGSNGGTGDGHNPLAFIKPGVAFDGGFVCMVQFPTGWNGSINASSNAWTTIVQDGGCFVMNGVRTGFSADITSFSQFTYFFFGQ